MNLKKLFVIALLLPTTALNGYGEWKPDEKLLQNIWKEVVKITEIAPNTPMHTVVFLEKNDPENFEKFIFKDNKGKIEVYLGSINEVVWDERMVYQKSRGARGCDISHKEKEALIYSMTAHGMEHSALHRKRVPSNLHHRQMKEKGYFLPVLNYINDYFKINAGFKSNRNGCQVDISMRSLEKAIKIDEKEIDLGDIGLEPIIIIAPRFKPKPSNLK